MVGYVFWPALECCLLIHFISNHDTLYHSYWSIYYLSTLQFSWRSPSKCSFWHYLSVYPKVSRVYFIGRALSQLSYKQSHWPSADCDWWRHQWYSKVSLTNSQLKYIWPPPLPVFSYFTVSAVPLKLNSRYFGLPYLLSMVI